MIIFNISSISLQIFPFFMFSGYIQNRNPARKKKNLRPLPWFFASSC